MERSSRLRLLRCELLDDVAEREAIGSLHEHDRAGRRVGAHPGGRGILRLDELAFRGLGQQRPASDIRHADGIRYRRCIRFAPTSSRPRVRLSQCSHNRAGLRRRDRLAGVSAMLALFQHRRKLLSRV